MSEINETPETDELIRTMLTQPEITPSEFAAKLTRKCQALEIERDALAKRFTRLDEPRYSGSPMMDDMLAVKNPDFDEWVQTVPQTYWARYDLSAARIGWEAARKLTAIITYSDQPYDNALNTALAGGLDNR